jgi:hypothetical protein
MNDTTRMYAPGHSDGELDCLSYQAEAFEPFTRQLFQQAGITTRMRVLNVGCGSGDVRFWRPNSSGQAERSLVPTKTPQL